MKEAHSSNVRRPTEEMALANIAREANRLGVSQTEIIRRLTYFTAYAHSDTCHCLYCRRQRTSFFLASTSVLA